MRLKVYIWYVCVKKMNWDIFGLLLGFKKNFIILNRWCWILFFICKDLLMVCYVCNRWICV